MNQLIRIVSLGVLGMGLLEAQTDQRDSTWFQEVGVKVGLEQENAMRSIWADLDGDGWADIILHRLGKRFSPGRIRVFHNEAGKDGRRVFRDWTEYSGLGRSPLAGGGERISDFAVVGDVDNDGDLDVFSAVTGDWETPKRDPETGRFQMGERGKPVPANPDPGERNWVFLNDGQGKFRPAKRSALQEYAESTCAAMFFDSDRDGILDLMVGNWYRYYGVNLECYPDRLFRGVGQGTFVERTAAAGLQTVPEHGRADSSRPTYGLSHSDLDGDGVPEILACAYGRQWNRLWKRDKSGRFVDIAPKVGFDGDQQRKGAYPPGIPRPPEQPFRSNGNTFGAACGDVDGDGRIDVFLFEIAHWWAGPSSDRSTLLINRKREGSFFLERASVGIERKHRIDRWNEGDIYATWLDADNDGRLDLLLASSDYPDDQWLRLFHQQADGRFVNVTTLSGFGWRNPSQPTIADYDRDGDLDILVGNSFQRLTKEQRQGMTKRVALFENRVGNRNSWITLHLEGKGEGGTNRSAIGTRVLISTGDRVQTREVYGGQGHAGQQNSLVCHFGLGASESVDRIEVRWAGSGSQVEIFEKVRARRHLSIREGTGKIRDALTPEQSR